MSMDNFRHVFFFATTVSIFNLQFPRMWIPTDLHVEFKRVSRNSEVSSAVVGLLINSRWTSPEDISGQILQDNDVMIASICCRAPLETFSLKILNKLSAGLIHLEMQIKNVKVFGFEFFFKGNGRAFRQSYWAEISNSEVKLPIITRHHLSVHLYSIHMDTNFHIFLSSCFCLRMNRMK